MTNIPESVVIEVDGHAVNVDKWDLDVHLARLKKEGRDVKVIGTAEETPPRVPTKTQLVKNCLDDGETDVDAIAEVCGCSIGLVKQVITKRG